MQNKSNYSSIYSFFRVKGFRVTFSLLRKLSGFTNHECFQELKKINATFPEYTTRDRKQIILTKLNEIKSCFSLNSQFFENACMILQKLWGILSNTTDRVVSGTISVLALIPFGKDLPNVFDICQEVEITQSAVIYQVKKLVKYLGVIGFTTLSKSKELLCHEVLEKVVGVQVGKIKKKQVLK